MRKTFIQAVSLLLFFSACKKAESPVVNNSNLKANKVFNAASPCGSPVTEAWFRHAVAIDNAGNSGIAMSAIDKDGNIISYGSYDGALTLSDSTHSVSINSGRGAMLIKYSPDGKLLWCKQLSGYPEEHQQLLVSATGDIYISTNYPFLGDSNYFLVYNGLNITKLDPSGNTLWSYNQPLGGVFDFDQGGTIALDDNENLYIYGYYRDLRNVPDYKFTCDLDPGPGVTILPQTTSFIEKFSPDGRFLGVKTTNLGRNPILHISKTGNVYMSQSIQGVVDIDPGPGVYNQGLPNTSSAVLYKLDPNENFKWAVDVESPPGGGNPVGFRDVNFHLDKNENICALVDYNLAVISSGGKIIGKRPIPVDQSRLTAIDDYNNFYVSYIIGTNLITTKYNVSGNQVWSVTKNLFYTPVQTPEAPASILIAPNGDVYITGGYSAHGANDFGSPFVIKYTQCNGGK